MKQRDRPTEGWSPILRWAAWLACLLASTALLVGPSLALYLRWRIDPDDNAELDLQIYLLSKTFHVSVYALLAVLTARLPASRRVRWLLILFLSLHAFGTEFAQQFVETRTGTPTDVALDHVGIVLGIVLTWNRWRVPAEYSAEPART